jgi:hypothetical protein
VAEESHVLVQMTLAPFGWQVAVLVRDSVAVADLGCQFGDFMLAGSQDLLRPFLLCRAGGPARTWRMNPLVAWALSSRIRATARSLS